MKKLFVWIIVAVMIALVVSCFIFLRKSDERSFTYEETVDLLKKGELISETNYVEKTNVYTVDPALRKTAVFEQAKYLKDNYYYMISIYQNEIQEYYYNKESNISYSVNTVDKTVNCTRNALYSIEKFQDYEGFKLLLESYQSASGKNPFRFHKFVNIDNKECVLVSLSCQYPDRYEREYYYIDKATGWVVRSESWLGTNEASMIKTREAIYERSYNTADDGMVQKFDISNYSGYVYYDVDMSKVDSVFDYAFDKVTISVKEDTITNKSVDVIFNTNGINEEDTIIRSYRLLKKEEGEYREISDSTVIISKDEELPITPELHIDFSEKYGELEAGQYDLVITIEKKGESNIKADLVTPFIVK